MTFRVAIPSDIAPGTFRVNLSTTRGFGPNCVTLQGTHGGFRAGESQLLVATGPPFTPALDQCGASFTTIEARASLLDGAGRVVLSTASIANNPLVRYSFVP
jgi:hypothetical protein